MQYRNRSYGPRNGNFRRRMRGIYGFPWLFVFFLIYATGWWQWLIIGIVISALLSMFFRSTMSTATGYGQQQTYYQPGQQQTYYQPSEQQGYQPVEPQEYQQYQQGYQPAEPPTPAQQDLYKQPGQEQAQTETYQDYEQPQTQYPQQMPPM